MKDDLVIASDAKPYWLYLLECADGSYYCGIAVDVNKRFADHLAGKGAAYTRSHRPVRILASQQYANRSSASKAEYALKQLPREAKPRQFETPGLGTRI